jgi:hypothetical protein
MIGGLIRKTRIGLSGMRLGERQPTLFLHLIMRPLKTSPARKRIALDIARSHALQQGNGPHFFHHRQAYSDRELRAVANLTFCLWRDSSL